MDTAGVLGLQVALLKFALGFAPERLDFIDGILAVCVQTIGESGTVTDSTCSQSVEQLLSTPLESYGDVLQVLRLENFPVLMQHLNQASQKKVALATVRAVHRRNTVLSEPEHITR